MSRLICSKFYNTLLFLFSTSMLVIGAGIHNMLVRIADRKDPDQTASSVFNYTLELLDFNIEPHIMPYSEK